MIKASVTPTPEIGLASKFKWKMLYVSFEKTPSLIQTFFFFTFISEKVAFSYHLFEAGLFSEMSK